MIILTVCIVAAVLAGIIASKKNRCVACWVIGAALLPIVILILVALDPLPASAGNFPPAPQLAPVDDNISPQCAETVKAAARLCRYCRYEFPPAPSAEAAQAAARDRARLELLDPLGTER